MEIKFLPLHSNVIEPEYATDCSAGFDLIAHNFKFIYSDNKPFNPNTRYAFAIRGADEQWYAPNTPSIPEHLRGAQVQSDTVSWEEENVITIKLRPGERVLIGLGFSLAIPNGYEMQIRPRSGKALKEGITVLNAPGTIDSDYRGEVGVILINHSRDAVVINLGDKIAQGVISEYRVAKWKIVKNLDETERNQGGFGSTDRTNWGGEGTNMNRKPAILTNIPKSKDWGGEGGYKK